MGQDSLIHHVSNGDFNAHRCLHRNLDFPTDVDQVLLEIQYLITALGGNQKRVFNG